MGDGGIGRGGGGGGVVVVGMVVGVWGMEVLGVLGVI